MKEVDPLERKCSKMTQFGLDKCPLADIKFDKSQQIFIKTEDGKITKHSVMDIKIDLKQK